MIDPKTKTQSQSQTKIDQELINEWLRVHSPKTIAMRIANGAFWHWSEAAPEVPKKKSGWGKKK
jgi:hypothetical protein